MNKMFLGYSCEIAVAELIVSAIATVVLLHVVFLAAKCRRGVAIRYLPYVRKWLLCRGPLVALILPRVLLIKRT